jgi:hypothetical protein
LRKNRTEGGSNRSTGRKPKKLDILANWATARLVDGGLSEGGWERTYGAISYLGILEVLGEYRFLVRAMLNRIRLEKDPHGHPFPHVERCAAAFLVDEKLDPEYLLSLDRVIVERGGSLLRYRRRIASHPMVTQAVRMRMALLKPDACLLQGLGECQQGVFDVSVQVGFLGFTAQEEPDSIQDANQINGGA